MSNNDDLINNILSELDSQKSSDAPESDTEVPQELTTDEPAVNNTPEETEVPSHEENIPDFSQQDNTLYDSQQYPEVPRYEQPFREAPYNRPVKKKKKKKKRSRLPGVLILTTFIFAVSICLSMVIIAFGKDMLGIGKSDTAKTITISEGVTTEQIAQMLKDEGIIRSPKFFMLFSRFRKSDDLYIPGEYLIRPNMAYETIINKFTTNESKDKESIQITFKEGCTIYDAAEILEKEGICNADDFIFTFNSETFGLEFEKYLPTDFTGRYMRKEGYLFPDTYFFYKEMEPVDVCQKIYINFNKRMKELDIYNKLNQLDATLDEVIILASIVQKEAANTEDMKKIASVFWNRLASPDFPKLESDPTKNYAYDVLKPHMDVVNKTMLESYDTYTGNGLPPGAISNPGIDAIDAVINPAQTDYYFFRAHLKLGKTLFAKTNEEHENNKIILDQEYAALEGAQ